VAVTLSRDERDALRADVLFELTTVGDIAKAVRSGNAAEARRLRVCFEEDMRLLDDLGWEEIDERERFELTMAPEQLAAVLRRLLERGPRLRTPRARRRAPSVAESRRPR
jgi:hypothetical protein